MLDTSIQERDSHERTQGKQQTRNKHWLTR
jgi:hypothetical protein